MIQFICRLFSWYAQYVYRWRLFCASNRMLWIFQCRLTTKMETVRWKSTVFRCETSITIDGFKQFLIDFNCRMSIGIDQCGHFTWSSQITAIKILLFEIGIRKISQFREIGSRDYWNGQRWTSISTSTTFWNIDFDTEIGTDFKYQRKKAALRRY